MQRQTHRFRRLRVGPLRSDELSPTISSAPPDHSVAERLCHSNYGEVQGVFWTDRARAKRLIIFFSAEILDKTWGATRSSKRVHGPSKYFLHLTVIRYVVS